MTYGAEIWGPPLIAAAGSVIGGMGNKETKMHKKAAFYLEQSSVAWQRYQTLDTQRVAGRRRNRTLPVPVLV
jgi:hypothetical protein